MINNNTGNIYFRAMMLPVQHQLNEIYIRFIKLRIEK